MPAPQCQVLFEMFASPRGKVWLGRLDIGSQAGRIVMLREINEAARPQLAQAVEVASALTHPKLLKVLGLVSDGTRTFVASEYIPGVSLFELIAAIRKRQRPMATGAAVRVIIDVLRVVSERGALVRSAAKTPTRLLHADCIWIADFGETLLAEAGVSAYLVPSAASPSAEPGMDPESQDVLTAAVELFHLATGRLMSGDICASAKQHLSSPLAKVVEGVFSWDPSGGFDSVEGFATSLAAMPPILVGTEASVAEDLQRLVPDLLDERRRKLSLLRAGSVTSDPEGPTRVYGSASERDADDTELAPPPTQTPERAGLPEVARSAKPAPEPAIASGERAKEPVKAIARSNGGQAPRGSKNPRSQRSFALRARALRARARALLRSRRVLLERALLAVLVVLVVVAVTLVLADPSRLRLVVDEVKALP